MDVLARWECPEHGDTLVSGVPGPAERYCSEHNAPVMPVLVEYAPASQLQGAVERVNAALRIVEDHRDARGNVQMGRGFASQVVELLRAAGGQ